MAITSFPINTKVFNDLDPITDAQATDADGVLFFDESVGVMKRMTKGELFKGKVIPIDSIAEFPSLDTDSFSNRQQFNLGSFAPSGEDGGGILLWEPSKPKSLHDGINYFSTTVPIPDDFDNPTDVANYRAGVGEEWPAGDGVFYLLYFVSREEFEALDDRITNTETDIVALENRQTNTTLTLATLSLPIGTMVETKGCLSVGDGGHGTFICEPPSGTPDGYSRIAAPNGDHWVLQPPFNLAQFGEFGSASVQRAINALPPQGGEISVIGGDFSNAGAVSASSGDKAVTWVSHNAKLPSGMPGVVIKSGVFSLPETSVQANRDARVHEFYDAGISQAVNGLRQYVSHITMYLPDIGQTEGEAEARAYSFDLGTNTTYNQADIRGMKGRVYAEGGNANLRAIYGVADGSNGHTGTLTGLIGTCLRDATSTSHAVAVRGHMYLETPGDAVAFQAAGNGGPVECNGYDIRGGSGEPLIPRDFGYQSHGGGTGDMYRGLKSHLDTTVIYRVRNDGVVMTPGVYSGSTTIEDDTIFSITPHVTSGCIKFWCRETRNTWGEFYYRVTSSPALDQMTAGTLTENAIGIPTGTTGADTKITIFAASDGKLYLENRTGAPRMVFWKFDAA